MSVNKMDLFGNKRFVGVAATTRKLKNKNADADSDALFEESYRLLKLLFKLKKGMVVLEDDDMDIDDLVVEQNDLLTNFIGGYDVRYMEASCEELSAARPEIQRRLRTAVYNTKSIYTAFVTCLEHDLILSLEEIDDVNAAIKESISHLITYIYFQFLVNITYSDLFNVSDDDEDAYVSDGSCVHVCESVRSYAKENSLDIVDVVSELHDIYQEYKPRLDIFENDPVMYQAFEDEVGALMADIIDLKGMFKESMARGILTGSYDFDDLIDLIDNNVE